MERALKAIAKEVGELFFHILLFGALFRRRG